MSVELDAILFLTAWSVASGLFGLWSIRKVKSDVQKEAESIVDSFMNGFVEVLTEPTVKKAFSIIGKQGGDARAENLLVDSMAKDMLSSPQFSAIEMGASALGFDLKGYIEEHGAVKTLAAASQLGKMLGIDIMNLDLGSLVGGSGGSSGSDSPYFRR